MAKDKLNPGESDQNNAIVPSNDKGYHIGEIKDLDPSKSCIIRLPSREHPEKSKLSKWPDGFWKHVNNGLSNYANGRYLKAREELLKARELKSDYDFLNNQLLKVYRKLYKKSISKGKWINAYNSLVELFKVVPDIATDYDRKQFNKVVTSIRRKDPTFDVPIMQLLRKPAAMVESIPFNIKVNPFANLKIQLEEITNQNLHDKKILFWNTSFLTSLGSICYRHIYNKDSNSYICHLRIYSDKGDVLSDQIIPHSFHKTKIAQSGNWLIGCTEDRHLFIYCIDGKLVAERRLLRIEANNKYHIRCVDISSNRKYALFTSSTRLFIMDSDLRVLSTWRAPAPEGYRLEWGEHLPHELREAISILELSDNPTLEEVKANFRRLIQIYHPDRNPGDKNAEEKTKLLISAYRLLTNDDPIKALKGLRNAEIYMKTINEYNLELKELGISYKISLSVSGPGDWIYATHITKDENNIYIGTYAGKVYQVDIEGNVLTTYIADGVIREIFEYLGYLYIETDYWIYIMHKKELVAAIELIDAKLLAFASWGFVIKSDKFIILYNLEGRMIGKIKIEDTLFELIPKGNGLIINTKRHTYNVLIKKI